jgi:tRNA (cmo5U34)-methyltransferase
MSTAELWAGGRRGGAMTIDEAFNASIEYYDDWIRKALPNYEDIFGTAQELIPFGTDAQIAVLDLGAGTGLFSKHVLEKCPKAKFVLYDLADKMLGVARHRFREYPHQFEFVIGDYRAIQTSQDFDLVISSLSIHHLTNEEKRELFCRIYGLLRNTGVFINIDQIRGETPYLQKLYWNHWLDQVRQAGASEERIRESVDRRVTYDRDALLSDQLQWLREAGFVNVDCVYKNYFIGVFLAVKK